MDANSRAQISPEPSSWGEVFFCSPGPFREFWKMATSCYHVFLCWRPSLITHLVQFVHVHQFIFGESTVAPTGNCKLGSKGWRINWTISSAARQVKRNLGGTGQSPFLKPTVGMIEKTLLRLVICKYINMDIYDTWYIIWYDMLSEIVVPIVLHGLVLAGSCWWSSHLSRTATQPSRRIGWYKTFQTSNLWK